MVDLQPTPTIEISKSQLSMMADRVKEALDRSLKALVTPDILLARQVIDADKAINSYEIDIDDSTFRMLTVTNLPSEILRTILSIE
jgi:phosphate uptake regulator